MVEQILFSPGGATEAKQDAVLASLVTMLAELQQKIEPGQQVALDAATLAALESITAVVSGTVALDSPTLAALESITATVSNFPADFPSAAVLAKLELIRLLLAGTLTVTGPLTDTQLRATPVPVSGTVTVGTMPEVEVKNDTGNPLAVSDGGGSLTVDGTVAVSNFPATQPVSGPLTDTQLRATPVPVSGTVTATGPLTDTQLRASAVTVDPRLGQTVATNTTRTLTSADCSPGSPWVSGWDLTRSLGYVRILTVLAASSTAVGGTFTFEFGENGTTATISESRVITDFTTVRDFDLINAGAYYRVKFEPTLALGGASVFATTTLRKQDDGAFVRLASQQIEEANAALPQTFSYLKAFNPTTGKSVNIRPSSLTAQLTGTEDALVVRSINSGVQPDGDRVDEKADGPVLTDTTVFGAGATRTFTSAYTTAAGWFDSDGWTSIGMTVKTNQVSGTNGLIIEYTDNPSVVTPTVLSSETFTFGTADVTRGSLTLKRGVVGRGFRVRYTNGGVAQTSFLLQINVRVEPHALPLNNLDAAIDTTNPAVMTRSALFAANPSGTYGLIGRGTTGGLQTDVVQHEVSTPIKPADTWKVTKVTATTTAAVLLASGSALTKRVSVEVYNSDSTKDLHINTSAALVTAGQFRTVAPGQGITLELGPSSDIAGAAASGSVSAEITEISDSTLP